MKNTLPNSANSANQPPDDPNAIDIPARAMPGRKIDAGTIAEMAKLVAKMLTESEACRRLGIKPRTWFDWKSRAGRNQKFADLLEAYRADRIESLIDRIEKSADGERLKYPDWRAALALLKITDQRRFGDAATVEISTGPVNITLGSPDNLAKTVAMYAASAKSAGRVTVQEPTPAKQLPPPAAKNDHEK
jgi:hypothetical protein